MNSNAERDYTFLALAGLFVLTVLLMQQSMDWYVVIPLALGALGIFVPGMVPIPLVLLLVLLLLAFRNLMVGAWMIPAPTLPLLDLFQAMAVLVYVAAHSRLLTLRRHALPPDARRDRRPRNPRVQGRWFLPQAGTRRTLETLSSQEFLSLALGVPAFALVAYVLWLRVALEPPPDWFEVPVQVWRAVVVLWGAAVGLTLGYALVSFLRWRLASSEESLLYLQDQLWEATRGEQRRINRWIVWRRLRLQRKEEQP